MTVEVTPSEAGTFSWPLQVDLESAGKPAWSRTLDLRSELLVGRDAGADLMLEDDLVSRRHVIVRRGAKGLEVEDVSTNGTLVDGQPLRRAHRRVGDACTLMLGASKLGLRLLGAPRDTPLPPQSAQPPVFGKSPEESANELRRSIHNALLQQLDMTTFDPLRRDDPTLRPRVLAALRRIVEPLGDALPAGTSVDALVGEMADEALGLGPLEHLLADPQITEIMVVDPTTIYVERAGKLTLSDRRFTDDERVRAVIERIVTPLGRRVDESSPLVDARLPDGSRVNIVIRPLALRGSCITIRKFARTPLTFERLCELGSLSPQMARFLERSVRAKKNVIIAGGTGSGKTTLLNVLSAAIPACERIVTIEDAAELQLSQPHVVSLESRPANMEGKGEVSIRDLVKNALRMRPDRIVVGECRGGEALDMLQAMNTGHEGSLATIHSNTPRDALSRLETMVLFAGTQLPTRAVREQIASAVQLIVQSSRQADGSRRVMSVNEVTGMERDMTTTQEIFRYRRMGVGPDGEVLGRFEATGLRPSFSERLQAAGLELPPGLFDVR